MSEKRAYLNKLIRLTGMALFFCFITNFAYAANSPPVVGIVTPSSGSSGANSEVAFTTTYSDANGWQNIQYVCFLMNTFLNGANCFYGYYNQNTNKLYLRNDANTTWLGGYSPGASNIIENSYAKLNCSKTTASGSGATLTVRWYITFKPKFRGTKYSYLYVRDDANAYNGWVRKGSWTITNQPPTVGTITPSSGSSQPNSEVSFTTTYNDSNGWQDIQYVYFLMNSSISGTKCFYGYYNQNTNKLYLRNDTNTAWLGGYTPGSNYKIENSYAKLNCLATSVSGSGNAMTIKWAVTFKSTFMGAKNMYLYVKDDANAYQNWVKKGTWTISADSIPPTGSITINNGNQYTNSTSVTLTLSAQDNTGGSGLASMQFSNDGTTYSAAEAYATTKTWTLTTGDGQKTVYVKFSDKAGNWSQNYSDTIILDTIPPQTTDSGIDGLWHNSPVTVTLTPTDSTSGIDKTHYSLDGSEPKILYTGPFTISDEGIYTIKYYSKDKAGNSEEVKTAANQVKIDKTTPTLTIDPVKSPTNQDVNITYSVTDNFTPSNEIKVTGNNSPYINEGDYVVTLTATDLADNSVTSQPIKFTIDKTPPDIIIINPSDNAIVNTTSIIVVYTVDGIEKSKQVDLPNEGVNTITITETDSAGNTASKSINVQRDTTPPTGSIKINNDDLYTNSPSVTLTLSAQDNEGGSGLGKMQFSNDNINWSTPENYSTTKIWELSNGDGEKTVYVKFSDNAGNWSQTFTDPVILDTAPPATTSSGIDNSWHISPVTVTLTAVDRESGINKTYYSIDGSNPTTIYTNPFTISEEGSYTIKYYSTDNAGNSEVVQTAPYQVRIDRTPPQGTITINDNAQYTNSTQVTLTLSATDSTSGIGDGSQMQFSNDNITWTTPEAYATTKSWDLTQGDGEKTVYVKFSDNAGNWSESIADSIILETFLLTTRITCDNLYTLYINGTEIGAGDNWSVAQTYRTNLEKGENVIAIKGIDVGGPASLLADFSFRGITISTNRFWNVSTTYQENWQDFDFDDSNWKNATEWGSFGIWPWGAGISGMDNTKARWIWSDDWENHDEVYFRLKFNASNLPPVISSVQNQVVTCAEDLEFVVNATDPENDPISWSVLNLPEGASFDAATRTFRWHPDYNQAGQYKVLFAAHDGNLWDEEEVIINVQPKVHTAPVEVNAEEVSARSPGWIKSGTELIAFVQGEWVEYKINFGEGGDFYVGLNAKNAPNAYLVNKLPEGYEYILAVYVDGDYIGDFRIPGNTTEHKSGHLPLGEVSGLRTISFVWTNDYSDGINDSNIQIRFGLFQFNNAPILDPIGDKTVRVNKSIGANIQPQSLRRSKLILDTDKKGEYAKGQIVVKFKAEAAQRLSTLLKVQDQKAMRMYKVAKEKISNKEADTTATLLYKNRAMKCEMLIKNLRSKDRHTRLGNIFIISTMDKNKNIQKLCEEFLNDPNVEYAEPNFIFRIFATPNDPYFNSQGSWGQDYPDMWGLKKINCEQVWDITKGSNEIIIGVIDTGIDYNHPDLASKIWFNNKEIPNNGVDDDRNGYVDDVRGWDFSYGDNDPIDGHGHGTHVAGTIGAVTNNGQGVAGINWNCKLMAIKGIDDGGSGYESWLSNAIYYAANNGARILSNSWGGSGYSQAIADAMDFAYSVDCVIVAAAGNDNADTSGYFPTGFPTVISVAASDPDDKKAEFSNWGQKIDVAAPGVDIISTYSTFAEPVLEGGVAVISDNNKGLRANAMEYSCLTPREGIEAPILYAGLGYADDFISMDFRGKIALIERGEIYFREKVGNAAAAGCVGAIIFNNETGNFKGTLENTSSIPAVSISFEDGEYLNDLIRTGETIVRMWVVRATENYDHWSGTSMACPHVSGLVGLILSKHPEFTNEDVRTVLRASADDIVDPLGDWVDYTGFDIYTGYGRLNAYKALLLNGVVSASITSPVNNATLRDKTNILGTAAGSGFIDYKLEYAPEQDQSSWNLIRESTQPVLNGSLGEWDVSNIGFGSYIIRVRATMSQPGFNTVIVEDKVKIIIGTNYQTGWPKETGGEIYSSPAVCDLDNDNKDEVIVGSNDGKIYAWHFDGSPVSGWPILLGGELRSSPAVSDLDNDGAAEIVIASTNSNIYCLSSDGKVKSGWPFQTQGPIYSTPALADLDKDGDLEIIVGSDDKKVYALHHTGALVNGWPVSVDGEERSSPAVGDIDNDGSLEVVAGSLGAKIYAWENDGSLVSGWPVSVNGAIFSSPAIADLDKDQDLEIVFGTNGSFYYCLHHDGSNVTGWPQGFSKEPFLSHPIADLDSDGEVEIISFYNNIVYCIKPNGKLLGSWPQPASTKPYSSAVISDIDSDGDFEILVGSINGGVFAIHHDGTMVQGLSLATAGGIYSTPVVCDLEKDGTIELICSSLDKKVYIWDLKQVYNPNNVEWQGFKNGNNRLGVYKYKSTDGTKGILAFKTPASDPDGSELFFNASNLPKGATYNLETGYFRWAPIASQAGEYPGIHFEVTDLGYKDSEDINISVSTSNEPPVLYLPQHIEIKEGELLEFKVSGIDPNYDVLTYQAQNLPDGATFFSQTGLFSWRPRFDQAGNYVNILFTISDGEFSTTKSIDINVIDTGVDTTPPAKPTINQAPSITNGVILLLSGTKDTDSSIWINGIEAVGLNQNAIWQYNYTLTEGQNNIIITSKDANGNESEATNINVTLDITPPTISITSPQDGAKIEL